MFYLLPITFSITDLLQTEIQYYIIYEDSVYIKLQEVTSLLTFDQHINNAGYSVLVYLVRLFPLDKFQLNPP